MPVRSSITKNLIADGDRGDIVVAASGDTFTLDTGAVSFAELQAVSANILLGNDASGTTVEEITCTPFARTILDDADAATAQATLGLVIGTNVQAYDADLTTWAGLAPSANAQSLVTAADYAAMKVLLGLTIGTNVQAYDADLTTWAGVTPGTGVATALAVNVGTAGAFVVNGGALGTPSSGVATNLTGTASGLTAGNVTTNANLTGPVTSVGNATTIADAQLASLAALTYAGNTLKVVRVNAGETDFELATVSGGSLSDGDKGDITVSSSGAVWTIDNDVVTYAKMQNVSATDKLLGRSTAGSGDVEEIACTAAGRAILDDASASVQRTTLGLVIGTNVQAYSTNLDSLTPLSMAGNGLKFIRVDSLETNFELADPATGLNDGDTLSTGLTFPNAGLKVKDAFGSVNCLVISPGSSLSANRSLTITTGDFDRTLTLGGNVTLTSGTHSGTNTGDQTSIVGISGTIAQFNTACSDEDFATGGGTATGTNTGDQTSIVGISGTIAQFNTACSDADFAIAARALNVGGCVTGGGDLSADRTFTVTAAVKSDQETATSTTLPVVPGVQQYHPSACKAWANISGSSTTPNGSYNVATVSNAAGETAVAFTTAMSGNLTYAIAVSCERANSTTSVTNAKKVNIKSATQVTTGFTIQCWDSTATNNVIEDPTNFHCACFGDQ